MNWVLFAAFIVAASAAKLDRTYLPPASALSAGGSPGSLLAPLVKSEAQSLPIGSFVNEHDGVVVDVAPVGTRASQSGLGAPRISYGSTDSKVGDAAFRGPPKFSNDDPTLLESNQDLSAFHQPSKPSRTSFQISRDNGAHITKYHNDIAHDRYSYGFEADNGIKAEEKGVILNGVQAEGGFSYVGDDGKVYSVAYTADQNGYRPVGSHLPTPPPIPAEILKALEQNSRDEAAGLSEDGSYDARKYNTGDYTKTDANGKYNDRQTIKFSIRPESRPDISGTLINQNKGAFIKPNDIGALQGTKDNTKLESSKISQHINGFGINFINKNNFDQGQVNVNAGIGTRNEFLQQNLQGPKSPNFGSSLINKDSTSVISPKPLSQQELQEPTNSGQDSPRPSSYDTSFSTVVSDNVPSKLNDQPIQEFVTRFDPEEPMSLKNQPMSLEESFIKPTQGVFQQNFGIRNSEPEIQAKPMNANIPIISKLNDQNHSQNSFTTKAINNQMSHNLNNRFSTLQSSTGTFKSFGLDQNTATNDRLGSTSSFFTAKKPILPTKQPERILTTPFESFTNNAQLPKNFGTNHEQYTGSKFAGFPGITSTSKFTSIPSTLKEIKSQTMPQFTSTNFNELKATKSPFSLSSQSSQNFDLENQQYKPTESKLQTMSQFSSTRPNRINLPPSIQDPNIIKSTQFNKQTQGPDTSYFYNKPSNYFSTNTIRPEINAQRFPTTSADQFDSSLISTQDNKFTEKNKHFTSSTYSQGTSGFNRQTNLPTLAPFSQTTISENKGSYQTNGITQASISSFPTIFPTSLNFKESGKNTFNPFQQSTQINSQTQFEPNKVTTTGILQSSVTDNDNFNENSNSQTQQYDGKIYEYNKPLQSFSSGSGNEANKQLGHLGAQFIMTTPFRAIENRTSNQNDQTSFGTQTSSQFGKQDKILDRNTTPFRFQTSNQQSNDRLTTSSIQNPTDTSETQNHDLGNNSQFKVYEYTKPLQSLTSTSAKEQLNKNENQETQFSKQFNKQSTTAYTGSYTETMDNFQKDTQLTTSFDQEEFERKTEIPEFSQTASTFGPSIYQYTKPVQSFLTTSKQDNGNSPLPQKETTVGVTSSIVGQQYSGAQEFGIPSFQDRFNSKQTATSQFTQGNQPSVTQFINNLSTSFPRLSQQQLGNNLNSEYQENIGEVYNYNKPNQTYSSSEQTVKPLDKGQSPQYNSKFQNKESDLTSISEMLTTSTYQNQPNEMSISTSSQVENSYNSQQRPQQNLQLSEIYEYSKPAQTLTTPVEDNILGQNINQQFGQRFDQDNSKPNIFNQNLSGDTLTTQNKPMSSPFMVTETNSNFEDKFTQPDRTTAAQTSFISGINSKPTGSRPQFAFQSACCGGFKTQKHQDSQFTHTTLQNTGSLDLKSNQNFEAQKLTTQGLTGEDFGGPRKPPSYDEKGYHY